MELPKFRQIEHEELGRNSESEIAQMINDQPEAHDFMELLRTHEPRALFNLSDRDNMISYLQKDRDPGFWHELLLHSNWDTPAPYWAAEWMLDQDDCENAVAVLILQYVSADMFMDGSPIRQHCEEGAKLVQKIVDRDQSGGFPSSGLSDSPHFSREQLLKRCLDAEIRAVRSGAGDAMPVPLNTLKVIPTGPEPKTSYFIDECSVSAWVPKSQLSN